VVVKVDVGDNPFISKVVIAANRNGSAVARQYLVRLSETVMVEHAVYASPRISDPQVSKRRAKILTVPVLKARLKT
jgi:hypothetical protein